MPSNLAQAFFTRARQLPNMPALMFKDKGNGSAYQKMTYADFNGLVKSIFNGLKARFDLKNCACAIYSQNCLNWVASDIAVMSMGGFTVPIYPTSSNTDIDYIIDHCRPQVLFVQNVDMLKKIEVLPSVKSVKLIVLFEDNQNYTNNLNLPVCNLSQLTSENQPTDLDRIINDTIDNIKANDLATVIYTSGTTGCPKGVSLTHKHILSVLKCFQGIIPITKEEIYLSYLPLSHVFERICGEFYWFYAGGIYAFASGVDTVGKNIVEVEPSMLLVVPRVLEFIVAKVQSGINGAKPSLRKLIEWGINTGKENFKYKSSGKKPPMLLNLKYKIADKLVLSKLRSKISSKLRLVVSGGAAGNGSCIEFFNAIGITTIEGYGLTETCAPVTVNLPNFNKIGTVGLPLPGVELKLNNENEIMVRGDSIFSNYYNNIAATKEVIDHDGWFKTGDIGTIDQDGFVKITDRKKDLIVNSAGKNIAPQRIENELKKIDLLSQVIVFGDKQKYLGALITLKPDKLESFANDNNLTNDKDIYKNQLLYDYIKSQIKRVCLNLADYEAVKRFYVLDHDLSVEASELTATMKVKRNVIAQKYKHIVEALFNDNVDLLTVSSQPKELVVSSQ